MSASAGVVRSIRALLRQRGMTYRQLAVLIGVSEPTVKRDMSRGDFSLQRMDRICEALEVSLGELLQIHDGDVGMLTQLSEKQERALVRDPRLLMVTYLLVNDWKWNEIVSTFRLDDSGLISVLLRLDELRIVDFRPPRRVRKLTARNFAWRRDGPVHDYFVGRVAPEFLRDRFSAPGDDLRFIGGLLSAASQAQIKASIGRVAQEFDELARRDARLPLEMKDGCSALLALRQWEFSEFTRLRRRA